MTTMPYISASSSWCSISRTRDPI